MTKKAQNVIRTADTRNRDRILRPRHDTSKVRHILSVLSSSLFQNVTPFLDFRKNTRHIIQNMSDLFRNMSDIFFGLFLKG